MKPTPKLRFVERLVPINETTATRVRILQQWWESGWGKSDKGEWRDVPLEQE